MIYVYTDGACSGNGTETARAGWAFTMYADGTSHDPIFEKKGRLLGDRQTNNRAELAAILEALRYISQNTDSDTEYTIHSDSEIMVNGLLGKVSRGANRDMWDEVEQICYNFTDKVVRIKHVDAHVGDPRNEYCDKLAREASRALLLPA